MSRHVMSCHVTSRRVTSRHVVSCQVMWSCAHVRSSHLFSCHAVPWSCHVLSCHLLFSHVMSCHAASHATPLRPVMHVASRLKRRELIGTWWRFLKTYWKVLVELLRSVDSSPVAKSPKTLLDQHCHSMLFYTVGLLCRTPPKKRRTCT